MGIVQAGLTIDGGAGGADGLAGGAHYRRPGWFTRNVFNRLVTRLTRSGISVWGSRVLEVPGRRTGVPRRTAVNLLDFEGRPYLVAPRGEAEWVRNVRAAGGRLDLLRGRHRSHMVATEVADDDKVDVLRAYLQRWRFEVGVFFDGVGPDSEDGELRRIAPRHPVFALREAGAG
jgi:deazaflavin-dependent oxidoreductase (nitroreductase family)